MDRHHFTMTELQLIRLLCLVTWLIIQSGYLAHDFQIDLAICLISILLSRPDPPNIRLTTIPSQQWLSHNLSVDFPAAFVVVPSPKSHFLTPDCLLDKDVSKIQLNRKISWKTPLTSTVIDPRPHDERIMQLRQNQKPPPEMSNDNNQFRRWMMRKSSFCIADIKEVFSLWDWKKSARDHGSETLGKIELLLGLNDVPWQDPWNRADNLGDKVTALLAEVMRRHGWRALRIYYDYDTYTTREYYTPIDPENPNHENLPGWIPWDYVNLEKPPPDPIAEHYDKKREKKAERSGLGWRAEDIELVDIENPYWLAGITRDREQDMPITWPLPFIKRIA